MRWRGYHDRYAADDGYVRRGSVGILVCRSTRFGRDDVWHSAPDGGETNNFVRYANPEVDSLIERVVEESTFAAQKPMFDRIQELIVADQPYTFLYEREAVAGLSTRIGGAVVNDATPFFNLDRWYIRTEAR